MGRMVISNKDGSRRLLNGVSLPEYKKAEHNLKWTEIMFIRHYPFDDNQLRVYIVGEEAIKKVSGLSFIPTQDEEVEAL